MADRKRLLTDLRVIDLRAELEKRNLDKSGVRGVLIQRLSKYLEDEGHDPNTFRFDLSSPEPKSGLIKRTRRSEAEGAAEPDSEETPVMEDMIVQDDAGEEEEADLLQEDKAEEEPAALDATDDSMNVDSEEKISRKRENKDETEATEAKKACVEKEEDHKTENNTDAEDSINLDLGEDELLNEETDNTAKHKKEIDMLRGIKMKGETERAALVERPALAQLIPDTDVDDAAAEDAAETASDGTATDNGVAATDATPADDLQVNADASATSYEAENGDPEQKDSKVKNDEKKEKKDDAKEGGARNLWVSGLSGDTRAKDLKQLCSKHGKVIGAKVVTNARTPGSRCYGYVTMASAQDAENCIKNLHRTELHGRMISVEKAKSESESASRRQSSRNERRSSKDEGKENEEGKEGEKNEKKKDEKDNRSSSRTREKSHRSDKDRVRRSTRSRERRRSPREVLSFPKIWKERDVTRTRDRSRAAREEERRRRAAEEALRERERRQRQEKHRLALEREKLRAEREKIEREKNELLRLERERHRLEREKLELERLELKRAQLRLEEERRKRGYESASYRKPVTSPPPEPAYERERHKRPAPPPMSSSRAQFEAPPPPRFEVSSYDRNVDKRDRDRDYKRDYPRHPSSSNMKYPSNGSSNDDARQPIPPGTRLKEPRSSYESRDTRSYRPSPPGKPEPRSWNTSSRYPDNTTTAKGSGGGSTEAWSSNESRYGSSYETRYQPAYQPPPPGAPYPDRYQPARDYRKY